jgi:hypothetical protein
MNVETISMPKQAAVAKIAAYRSALKRRASDEYKQALAGYEELAKGTVLIDPFQAIREAGRDAKGRPLLAICRADRKRCEVDSEAWKRIRFNGSEFGVWDSRANNLVITVDQMPSFEQHFRASAIVPMIPADVYPAPGHGSPKDWYILWEAEWQNVPPKDPLLLKPIGGDLYAVLASWDLTELERKIIARR